MVTIPFFRVWTLGLVTASFRAFFSSRISYCKFIIIQNGLSTDRPLSQLPSNLLLRKLGVTNWLGFCVISWGFVQLSMGFVPTWEYLGLCRVLLGAFEVRTRPKAHER